MPKKPCLVCGSLSDSPRCPAHKARRTPEQETAHNLRRKQLTTGAARTVRARINRLAWHLCATCSQPYAPRQLEVDHIVPLHSGGQDHVGNLQILCVTCHRRKTTDENPQRGQRRTN